MKSPLFVPACLKVMELSGEPGGLHLWIQHLHFHFYTFTLFLLRGAWRTAHVDTTSSLSHFYFHTFTLLLLRGAWRTAHVDTTSSTGRESVPPQTLGTIHLAASPSVFQRAGRYKDFIFGLEGNLFIEVLLCSQQRIGTCNCGTYVIAMKRSNPSYGNPKRAVALLHQRC